MVISCGQSGNNQQCGYKLIYQHAVGWIPIIMDLITFRGFIIGIQPTIWLNSVNSCGGINGRDGNST